MVQPPDPPFSELLNAEELAVSGHLGDELQDLVHAYLVDAAAITDLPKFHLRTRTRYADVFQVQHDEPVVDLTVTGDLNAALDRLRRVPGVEILAVASTSSYHLISALVPVERLLAAAGVAGVVDAHAAGALTGRVDGGEERPRPTSEAGGVAGVASVTTQGVADNQAEEAIDVDAAKRVFTSLDGSGIAVGTLSDSVGQVGNGIADSQATGDLPPNARINVVQDLAGSGTDEGRAMMEHIYDLLPQVSTLGFATAGGGEANFAANIAALGTAGMDVINDDVVYYAEPVYQDGVVAQAVNTFVSGGGVYLSLDHNFANLSYEAVFSDLDGDSWHAYAGDDEVLQITVAAGTALNPISFPLALQWAQPWGNATTDLRIEVWNSAVDTLLQSSSTNNVGGNPYDAVTISNTSGAALTLNIAVKRISGSVAGLTFKLIAFDNGASRVTFNEYLGNAAGTLTPHAGTPLSIAVAAAPWYSRDTAESFSGRGPFRRFFDSAGNPVGPYTYDKPDITSVDKCNTTFFGRDIAEDADAYPNFSGTSAATPNAAAVAALLLQAAGGPGSLSQNEVKAAMSGSAVDLGSAGFDTTYGDGRVHALGAVLAARGPLSTEYTLYLNQYGDVSFDQDLFGITDVDRIEFATASSGAATATITESHVDMDPMIELFYQVLDTLVGVDYDGGVGDDASLAFSSVGGIPYTLEVASEEGFTGGAADYTLTIDAPNQPVLDRTASLDGSGADPGYHGSLVIIGDSDYVGYIAPGDGRLNVTLEPTGFVGRALVYDDAGSLLGTFVASDGSSGEIRVSGIGSRRFYVVQVVSNGYEDTGSYTLRVAFDPASIFSDNFNGGTVGAWSMHVP